MRRTTLAVALLALLSAPGCGVAPTSLKPVTQDAKINLDRPFTYVSSGRLGPVVLEHTMQAGTYQAIGENDAGRYYHGPKACYSLKVLDPGMALRADTKGKVMRYQDCGLFVPNDSTQPVRIYVVNGSDTPAPPPSTFSSE